MTTTDEKKLFESLVNEFREKSSAQKETEVHEGYPLDAFLYPGTTQPYDVAGPPFVSPWTLTEESVRAYAHSIGDDNPLYTDAEYAKKGPYGCLTAPGTALLLARNAMWHGATRQGGWPIANFHSGTAWEFFDVLRAGTGFKSSAKAKDIIEKPGTQGNLFLFISDVKYWDMANDLLGKCYGTLIMVPQESMGHGRAMDVEKLGEKMMYVRGASKYNKEQIDDTMSKINSAKPRGKERRFWEDVEIGDKVGPFVLPPWTDQDYSGPGLVRRGQAAAYMFEPGYRMRRHIRQEGFGGLAYTHPVSKWPWGAGEEHGDALFAAYRGQALPFDWGGQRSQIPQGLISNWMGDHGFIRRLQMALRRPMYYADVGMYTGEVVKKFTEVQKGDNEQGGTPGDRTYHAIGIKWEGANQVGQTFVQGQATVYLPSRQSGDVKLPIPHLANPPYVPYEKFYRDWY